MPYMGDFRTASTLDVKFTTIADTGAPTQLAGTPAASVYKDNSITQSTSGVTLTVDFDALTGLNNVRVDTSLDGTFYSAGSNFEIVLTAGTVSGVSVVGYVVASFSLEARSALMPTTSGRKLTVESDGMAHSDLKEILGVAVSTSTAQLGVNAVQVGGASPETSATISDAVWDEALAGHVTAGSAGKAVSDIEVDTSTTLDTKLNTIDDLLDTEIAAIKADTAAILLDTGTDGVVIVNGGITAAKFGAGAIDAAALAADAANEIADALLNRNVAGGSSAGRLVKHALYRLINKVAIAAGTLTVYGTDDTTAAFTQAVTTTAGDPISSVDTA